MIRASVVWLTLALLLLVARPAAAADGDLDPSFDDDGIVVTDIDGGDDQALGAAIDAEGRLIVVGQTESDGSRHAFVARYLADGRLDDTFASNGTATVVVGTTSAARAVDIDQSGRIVVAGWTDVDADRDALVIRLLGDGSPDPTFSSDGIVTLDYGTTFMDSATSLVLRPLGNVIVGGSSTDSDGGGEELVFTILVELTDEGEVTPGFDYRLMDREVVAMAASSHGSTIVVFESLGDSIVQRIEPDGSLGSYLGRPIDPDDEFDGLLPRLFDVDIDERGRTVLAARDAVGRVDHEGRFDSSFSVDGWSGVGFDVTGVAVDPIERPVVIGHAPGVIHVGRTLPSGYLDPSFSWDGHVEITEGSSTELSGHDLVVSDLAIDELGNVVVVGTRRDPLDSSDVFAVRIVGDGTPTTDRFIDDDNSVFESDVDWLAWLGITRGCNPPIEDRFCPDDLVTRGQMAAFLVRALPGLDLGDPVQFTDDDHSEFEPDIERLAAAGVTMGCNPPANTRFCPEDHVTRGQMAAFLARALGLVDDGTARNPDRDTFTDDDGSVFETDIEKLVEAGLTAGCNPPEGDRYCPDAFVTRGQMAAFLHRALG